MAEFLAQLLLQGLAYGTAKLVVPLLTIGRVRVDVKKSGSNWLSGWPFWSRHKDGRLYLGPDAAIFVGIGLWVVAIGFLVAAAR